MNRWVVDGRVAGQVDGRGMDGNHPGAQTSLQLSRTGACTPVCPVPPTTLSCCRARDTVAHTLGPAGPTHSDSNTRAQGLPTESGQGRCLRPGPDARPGSRAPIWTLSLEPPSSLQGTPLGFWFVPARGHQPASYHDGLGLLGVQLGDGPAEALGLRRGSVGGGHDAGEVRAPSPQPSAGRPLIG